MTQPLPRAAASTAQQVLLLGSAGWHERQLSAALRDLGLRATARGFKVLGFTTASRSGLALGPGRALPAAVLVRSIPPGSFEQVTTHLSVLHALGELGVPVVNPARAIERCVDKAMTTFLLRRAGLPVPETWVTCDPVEARAIVAREAVRGHAVVLKPLFGSQGQGLRLLRGPEALPAPAEVAQVYYLQRYVGTDADWQDYRVLVVGGEAVAAMRRHGAGWITNVRQGGRPEAVSAAGDLGRLAVAAVAAVGAVVGGVDLIHDVAGRLLLLEVNSMPAWQGLQQVTPFSLAGRVAAAVAARVAAVGTLAA